MNTRMKRFLALMLSALLAWSVRPAVAEEIRGATLLTWEADEMEVSLWLAGSEYDWSEDPEGVLAQILPGEIACTRHAEQEEPCAVMQLRVGTVENYVESVGELDDYANAGRMLLSAMGLSVAEETSLSEVMETLCGREAALSEDVTGEAWRTLCEGLWGMQHAEAEGEAAEIAALTFGEMYADLLRALDGQEAARSLAGYQAEFEAREDWKVNWAFLLSTLSETISPSGESYPYLVFGGEADRRLILQGEAPEYTVRLYVDDECIEEMTVKEGEDVSLPNLPGVTWVSDGKNIQTDRILCGYTDRRVTFRLKNAEEYAGQLGDLPVEWVQSVLYGHRVRPSVRYMEALAENGLSVEWDAKADERVWEDKVIEGRLLPSETGSPAPTQTPAPTATPLPETCTVTFVYPAELGYTGEEARVTVEVSYGGMATPPEADEAHRREHYTLCWPEGWENVTEDRVIEGVLEPKTYTVRWRVLDENGAEYAAQEQAHVYGTALTPPAFDLPAGQRVKWDALPEEVTGDSAVTGRLEEIRIVVSYRLVALDGSVSELGTETIEYGGNAKLPLIDIPEGCEVTWSGALSGLTEDTVVTGTLTRRQYTVTIQIFDADGSVYFSSTQQVAHGGEAAAPAFTAPEGCTFAWDVGTSFEQVTADRTITGRLTRVIEAQSAEQTPASGENE